MKPFFKWAGGKTQLLEILHEHKPSSFERYYEPFLGGGAFFLSLQPKSWTISDINPVIVNAWKGVDPDDTDSTDSDDYLLSFDSSHFMSSNRPHRKRKKVNYKDDTDDDYPIEAGTDENDKYTPNDSTF